MEKQIKNLIELAEQYYQYAIEEDFPSGHTWLQTDYGEVGVYLSTYSRRDYSVKFDGEVEVAGYANRIAMGFTATSETLEKLYNNFSKYLKTEKDKIQEQVAVQRAEKIKNLEEELSRLKNL
jgi:lipoate-protein ligase A